jgi:hypothetical protein
VLVVFVPLLEFDDAEDDALGAGDGDLFDIVYYQIDCQ